MDSRNSTRKNQKYSIQKRKQLLRLVVEQKFSISRAGKILGFKQSTAKMVLRKFKTTGKVTIFKKQAQIEEKDQQNDEINRSPVIQNSPLQINTYKENFYVPLTEVINFIPPYVFTDYQTSYYYLQSIPLAYFNNIITNSYSNQNCLLL